MVLRGGKMAEFTPTLFHYAWKTRRRVPVTLVVLSVLLCQGCMSWTDPSGTTHHLIIGVGFVRCNETKDKQVLATYTTAFGVTLSDSPGLRFGLGYSSGTVVSVSSDAPDVLVDVKSGPYAPIVIDTHRAGLMKEEEKRP